MVHTCINKSLLRIQYISCGLMVEYKFDTLHDRNTNQFYGEKKRLLSEEGGDILQQVNIMTECSECLI
jgi:hypothetical protein